MIKKKIEDCFFNSPFKSIKHNSYFATYEKLFSEYVGKKITFVEVGILNGGSLFMWRDYFGKQARIIGIDNNPEAKKWIKYDFEIFIGDQSDPKFWNSISEDLGEIDILLDDGGHLDHQQSTTLFENIEKIKDNGLIVIEDTHSSYMKEFGNPNKYSFMNLVFKLINKINYRSSHLKKIMTTLKFQSQIFKFFESIISFRINRINSKTSSEITNNGKDLNIKDFRHANTERISVDNNIKKIRFIKKIPLIGSFLNYVYSNYLRDKIYNYFLKKKKKVL